jgi:TetR/AcrR family transcriptional regulator
MELNTHTENKILEAAEKVFQLKGKAGTSMQDIADEAGITRTSLNYYFRSKDILFESVFKKAMGKFVPNIVEMMTATDNFKEYLPKMVNTIIDTMIENPQIPIFVLQELSSNPTRMPEVMIELGIDPNLLLKKFNMDQEMNHPSMDPRQIIMNVLSLCIFPFAARAMVQTVLFDGNEEEFIAAMKQRKILIPMMIEKLLNMSES